MKKTLSFMGAAAAIGYLVLIVTWMIAYGLPSADEATSAGFFAGLVHGALAPVTLVASLVHDSYEMYQCDNVGFWYDFAFLWGVRIASSSAADAVESVKGEE